MTSVSGEAHLDTRFPYILRCDRTNLRPERWWKRHLPISELIKPSRSLTGSSESSPLYCAIPSEGKHRFFSFSTDLAMRSLLLLVTLAVALGLPALPGFTCRPGKACWPSALEWKVFNKTIGGNLYATVPIGAPCFPSSPFYNTTTCNTIKANYKDASFRQSFSGNGLEYTNFESCGNFSCLPSVYGPQTANCSLGRLSSYFVKVQHRLHVAATVAFATLHNIRLVIRNTGHDYLGRSSSANSLALVTQDLKAIQIVEKFKAFNCPAADGYNVGIIGAGVVSSEAAAYFNSKGFAVAAGSCPSVGTAGGFGQTAGHGLYARGYGLMVDLAGDLRTFENEMKDLTHHHSGV